MNTRVAGRHRQRGVAIITALLLTTLAITIVASLFWQQQVQVRSIENQRLQLQKQWILRGALDWARLILREDARSSRQDYLGEPWSVPLAPTQLSRYVDGGSDRDAILSGHIVDAQSRFNLANLSRHRTIDAHAVAVFARLLARLQLDPSLAQACAQAVAAGQLPPKQEKGAGLKMPLQRPADLLAVPGMTPAAIARLQEYVTILPRATPVNVNTASAPVLSAILEGLSPTAVSTLLAIRARRYFRDRSDLQQNLPLQDDGTPYQPSENDLSFASDFFIVYGNVQMDRARLGMQALIERSNDDARVIAMHEE